MSTVAVIDLCPAIGAPRKSARPGGPKLSLTRLWMEHRRSVLVAGVVDVSGVTALVPGFVAGDGPQGCPGTETFDQVGVGEVGAGEADQVRALAEPVLTRSLVGRCRTALAARIDDERAWPGLAQCGEHVGVDGGEQVDVTKAERGERG